MLKSDKKCQKEKKFFNFLSKKLKNEQNRRIRTKIRDFTALLKSFQKTFEKEWRLSLINSFVRTKPLTNSLFCTKKIRFSVQKPQSALFFSFGIKRRKPKKIKVL